MNTDGMDIEGFYDADPRRRASDEISFGRDWLDADGQRFELNWVVDTGELYLMGEPAEPVEMDALGDAWVQDLPVDQIKVEILGSIAERSELDSTLAGWEAAMDEPDGVAWIRQALGSTS
ncbi:MAG: hypothetical protein ACOYML_04395 [Microthrixaceae bacterium]